MNNKRKIDIQFKIILYFFFFIFSALKFLVRNVLKLYRPSNPLKSLTSIPGYIKLIILCLGACFQRKCHRNYYNIYT